MPHLTLTAHAPHPGPHTQAGYAVIFLNRKHSIQPFTKGLPSGEIMECLTEVLEPPSPSPSPEKKRGKGGHEPASKPDGRAIVRQLVSHAAEVHKRGVLLRISFETLFEYLKVGLV